MDTKKIDKLLELIQELVDEPDSSWKEKALTVLAQAHDDERTALEEFCSWFEVAQ